MAHCVAPGQATPLSRPLSPGGGLSSSESQPAWKGLFSGPKVRPGSLWVHQGREKQKAPPFQRSTPPHPNLVRLLQFLNYSSFRACSAGGTGWRLGWEWREAFPLKDTAMYIWPPDSAANLQPKATLQGPRHTATSATASLKKICSVSAEGDVKAGFVWVDSRLQTHPPVMGPSLISLIRT